MKLLLKTSALAVLILLGSALQNNASAQNDYYDDGYYEDEYYDDRGDVSYQTFYDELSPHGNWVEYPGHGYVWQPRMGNDFRPYNTGGHWVWSDRYEWVWVSDYDWGWAPFHYGRWFHDPYYGWLWVPGYEWSGAWVTWRQGGDYYGWAPLRPGLSISINFNIGGYHPPHDWWTFTPSRYVLYRDWRNHCVDYRRNVTIINNTTIINNYHYGDSYGFRTGPRRTDFERYTGRVTPVQFRQSNRPGRTTFRNNEVSIYRPSVREQSNNPRIAPRRFERYDRNAATQGTVRNNDTRSGNPNNGDFRTRNRETDQPADIRTSPNGNRRFERNDRPQTQENGTIRNNPQGNRRFERNPPVRSQDQPERNTEIRPQRPDRPVRSAEPRNGNAEPRFERRRENPANQSPVRQQQPRVERRQSPQVDRPQPQQRMERQTTPRVERRTQPQQQQQPRQMERRDNGSSSRQPGNTGNGNGRGNRRF